METCLRTTVETTRHVRHLPSLRGHTGIARAQGARRTLREIRRLGWLAAAALLACGCGGPGSRSTEVLETEQMPAGAALIVHPVYNAAFEALEAALDAEDTLVAEATLARLNQRLKVDLANAPTIAQAREREDEIAARTLSGELPSRENVRAAMQMAEGFERVIQGRKRMESLELTVLLTREAETETVTVTLQVESDWPQPLTLEPGPGSLEVLRTSLEPRTGGERREARLRALEAGGRILVPAEGTATLALVTVPVEVPVGAIATRMEVRVGFNGGALVEGSLRLPMREVELSRARRVDLAGWVPASLVEPLELVELVERGGAPLPALLERAVRISPDRRDETLDRLGKALLTLPEDAFAPAVPAVRWIVGTNEFGRDERAWRNWLVQRYEARVSEGRISGAD